MKAVTEKIEDMIAPVLSTEGYDVVRIQLAGNIRKTLQIMIERKDGVEVIVKDCEKVSRLISALLDVEDPLHEPYVLEVSSPGIDRPLVKPKDFKRFCGHAIKISLYEAAQGRKRFIADLTEADDECIKLVLLEGEEQVVFDIPYSQIQNAKLYIDFDNYRVKGKSGDQSTNQD